MADHDDVAVFDNVRGLPVQVLIVSFGYLHGDPEPSTCTVDLRRALGGLVDPAMASMTGLDQVIRDCVLAAPGVSGVISSTLGQVRAFVDLLNPRLLLTRISIGSDEGRQRSVVVANEIGHSLRAAGVVTEIEHRDVARPASA